MLKLSRNGIGVLSSQYRSVLKKCALLNLVAAGMLVFASQAQAAHITGVNSPSHELDLLKGMGTTVGKYEGTTPVGTYGKLYITGSMANTNTKEMFSAVNSSAGWLVNYSTVFFGTQPQDPDHPDETTYIKVPATVSDKHNLLNGTLSSLTPNQGGGVIRNDTDLHTGSPVSGRVDIYGSTFKNNSVTNFQPDNDAAIAAGGFISNVGAYDASSPSSYVASQGSTYINNYTMQFTYADGGAIYNGAYAGNYGRDVFIGKFSSKEDTFEYNHTGNENMQRPEAYDVVREAVTSDVYTNILYDWEQKSQQALLPNGVTYMARGGAIYNAGEFTIESDTFLNNYVTGYTSYGGAIFNTDRQYPYADTSAAIKSDDGHLDISGTTKFDSNKALATVNPKSGSARGGAIANEGTTLNFNSGLISSVASNYTFKDNSAEARYQSYGGAIYNGKSLDTEPKIGVVSNINHATFNHNYAIVLDDLADKTYAWGGAIYNDGDMTILDATFTNNYVMTSEGFMNGTPYGGAIANNTGTLKLGVHDTELGYQPQDIIFSNNRAGIDDEGHIARNGQGGAIYNGGGKIDAVIAKSVVFTGNRDIKTHVSADRHEVSSAGGAIYGDVTYNDGEGKYYASDTTFTLSGTGAVKFENFGQDNVFMKKLDNYSATISFIGNNSVPVERNSSNATTSSIDENATRVDLGATFTGTGKYVIKQTQLNLIDGANGAGTGYIHFDPSISMKDSVVNMEGTGDSYIYLTSQNDTLENNDFYIDNKKAILYYGDYDSTYRNFTLGNYIENNGLIIYDDKPQNGIAGKMYPDEKTSGDTDIKIATTLVNRGIVTTASDNFITKNIHIGTLESENGAIYINMDNDHLIRGDNEHVLVPEEKEGYDFGTYFGDHYESEVIVIDKAVSGTTKITLVDLESNDYKQIKLDESQRIYFAKTQYDEGLEGYQWNVVNAVNDDYKISIGYDQNGSVYDWFLYRGSAAPVPGITPEEMVSITIPRATLEQLRSFRFPLDKTNRGQCSCYKDNCDNSFCQYEQGSPKTRLWATPFYRQGTFEKPFDTDFKLLGIDAGVDFQPTSTDLIGVFGSYRFGKYENDGNQKHYGDPSYYFSEQGGEFELKSLSAGLYYRKYIDKLYLMGAVYAGKLDGDIKADNGVKGSIKGKHLGVQAEIGYDVKLTRRDTLTPSVRGTYDYIKYDKGHTSNGKEISIGKINSFEIEAALKLEHQFNNSQQLPTTGYVKPSIIQTIPDGGKVKVDDREYKKTLDNETLGRIEIGADTNLTTGFSVGVFGNYTFGSHYDAWGIGGNVRYVF